MNRMWNGTFYMSKTYFLQCLQKIDKNEYPEEWQDGERWTTTYKHGIHDGTFFKSKKDASEFFDLMCA